MDVRIDPLTQRPTCHFALARLEPIEAIRPFERFSDEPEADSVWNEASMCDVAPLGDGFLLLWQQVATRFDSGTNLLAQRIGPDGSLRGERLMLREGLEKPVPFDTLMASNGTRVAVAIPAERDSQSLSVAFIEADSFETTPLALTGGGQKVTCVQLTAAHGGYLARTSDSVWLLDSKGRRTAGPKKLAETDPSQTWIGPLGDGYVVVQHDEYLTATSLDARFASPSAPAGLSVDRGAHAYTMLGDAAGTTAAVVFYDANGYRVATLGCSDKAPAPLGSSVCPKQKPLMPLADGCTDPVCHVVLRFDYLTLGLRGWAAVGGKPRSFSQSDADTIASDVFETNSPYGKGNVEVQGPEGGLYYGYKMPADFGGFVLVSAETGAVVVGGSVLWSGKGRLWPLTSWNDPEDLACGDSPATPVEVVKRADLNCRSEGWPDPASIDEALDTALRTNLVASVAARGPFDAYAYLYTPSVGACDPSIAEYIVVLSQQRP